MKKKQHYMTRDERHQLEAMHRNRIPVAEIARQLGFCRQTIYNELKRGAYIHTCKYWDEQRYSAQKAQQIHDYQQTAKGRPLKIGRNHAYAAYLEKMIIGQRYSPAAALAAAQHAGYTTRICTATLYSYIDKRVFLDLRNEHLWQKRKRKPAKGQQRIAHPQLPSITQRPEHINNREEFGHWEMDLVIGKKGSSAALLTLTERRSRQEIIMKLPDRKAATIRKVIDEMERADPLFTNHFKSITTDNGPEFLDHDKLVRSVTGRKRFSLYYCHSYAAWEKGSNENHNRMIRRFYPKGTDFTTISKKEIAELQNWMNSYPRKILNWKTPKDVWITNAPSPSPAAVSGCMC